MNSGFIVTRTHIVLASSVFESRRMSASRELRDVFAVHVQITTVSAGRLTVPAITLLDSFICLSITSGLVDAAVWYHQRGPERPAFAVDLVLRKRGFQLFLECSDSDSVT